MLPIYGGQPIGRQLRALRRGVDVVVATPGRALDHIGRGTLNLREVRTVVLDEADEMLDMGFAEDIEAILDETARRGARRCCSRRRCRRASTASPASTCATRCASRSAAQQTPAGEAPQVRQSAYIVPRAHKPAALGRVLDVEAPTAAIVFCRTRDEVDQLTETLNGRGYRAEALHGGMSQEQRDRVMGRLRSGTADLLVATDVAARGLDIEQLTHVVNYDVPSAAEAYVHRIGRVGRAGREGVAITLAEPREHRMLKTIERVTKQRITIEKVPTVADLRAPAAGADPRRAAGEPRRRDDDLDRFRVVVETLTDEFDMMEVALAAVKLAHEAGGGEPTRRRSPTTPAARQARRPHRARRDRRAARRTGAGAARPAATTGPTRLFVGVGPRAGIRPQDLVGAIAGESELTGRDIGAIEIADRFSLVEVPAAAADEVIAALRRSTIKGKRATVRRERFTPGRRQGR